MQKIDIWLTLAREKFPLLTEDELKTMSMVAATEWFDEYDTELAKLFDQYVMMKNLYGADGAFDVR